MDSKNKNKWQVRVAVLAIFLLGAVAGAFALTAYNEWVDSNNPRQVAGRANLEQTFDKLGLTEEQQAQVRGIFDTTRNQMRQMRSEDAARRRNLRRQTDEQLQKILSPDQWQQFQQIRRTAFSGNSNSNRDKSPESN